MGAESTGAPAAHLVLTMDDRVIEQWDVAPGETLFKKMMLPAGALGGTSTFKRLMVGYANPDGTPGKVRLTQFAVEPSDALFFIQHAGWNEIEYSKELQRRWRWTTATSSTFINSGWRDISVSIAG